MFKLTSSNELGSQIARLLGLPDHLLSFTVKFVAGAPVVVECESYASIPNSAEWTRVLGQYHLVKGEADIAETGFDAWMAARREVGHRELLATYKRLSAIDARMARQTRH